MHFDIPRLSNENLIAGGNGKVTLIGYSLSGLIAKHYLLEKTGYPWEQNLNVDTKINKVIFIASPINGNSVLLGLDQLNPALRPLVIKTINKTISFYQNKEMGITKDVGDQLCSNSQYLNGALQCELPQEVEY